MSFIKRSGISIYSGDHYISRGELGQVKNGMLEDSEQDQEWEMKVTASMMSMEDSYNLNCALDNELFLWELYKREKPEFNEDYFWPGY